MKHSLPPKPRPQDAEIDGVLLIDKQPDMTSHDVVAVARRALGTKKIGHCGTLDPMATGLLILVIGRGTKMQDLLMAEEKEYPRFFTYLNLFIACMLILVALSVVCFALVLFAHAVSGVGVAVLIGGELTAQFHAVRDGRVPSEAAGGEIEFALRLPLSA